NAKREKSKNENLSITVNIHPFFGKWLLFLRFQQKYSQSLHFLVVSAFFLVKARKTGINAKSSEYRQVSVSKQKDWLPFPICIHKKII
ncbi:MAG: hypothetical protein LBH25_08965, partial [Fibromonadaceae bacterium]|nr:hypothetical protein [Fibromonadaceae bacterium]